MKNKKVWIIAGIIAVVLIAAIMSGGGGTVSVDTFKVERKPFTGYIEETGIVEARGSREVQAVVTGKIAEINVAEGQRVKAGDVLAVLDKGDLLSEVERTQAAVEGAKSQLEKAVKGAEANEIAQAVAEVNQARTSLAEAKRQESQAQVMLNSGGISSDEYQQKVTAVKLQQNNLAIAEARLKMLRSGAGASDREALQSQVEQAQAQLKSAQLQLFRASITAPVDGIILRKMVEPGAYIQPGTPLFKVGSATDLEVRADILETEAVKVKAGQKVIIAGEVLDGQEISGTVTRVAPEAVVKVSTLGVEQRRVPVKISLTKIGVLKPGFNVEVRIVTGESGNTLSVPEESVFTDKEKDYVFVVENDRLVQQLVKTGLRNQDSVEVVSGLKAGAYVVKQPDNKLTAGIKVKKVESTQ